MTDQTDQLRDAAMRAAVWQTIEAKAKEQKDFARAELASIPVGETVAGSFNGEVIAKASMAKGKAKMVTTSEAALLAWVQEHHPTELVVTVNPAFLKSLEARAKTEGLGAVIDSQGDVVPGLEIVTSNPTVSVRREAGADAIVAELLTSGRVTLDGITPAIEATVVDGEVVG